MNHVAVAPVGKDRAPYEEREGPLITRTLWTWARLAFGGAVLAVLVARLGAGPFVAALSATTVPALILALVVTAVTTLACSWRWHLVAHALGADISVRDAFPAYYRSQLVNAVLPGGVVGDAERAVRHGRDVDALARGVRSVAWERAWGQVVQVALTASVLLVVASPLRAASIRVVAVTLLAATVVVGITARTRAASVMLDDLRSMARKPRTLFGVVTASSVSALGHVVVFLVAAHVAGVSASPGRLLPIALVVLLSAAIPTNIAGWGPREGVAAWAFATSGLGAAEGVTVAAVYGVLSLVATLPGVIVLLMGRRTPIGVPVQRRNKEAAYG